MSTGEEDWGLLHVELSPSAMKQPRTHLDWGEVPPSDFRLDVDEDSATRLFGRLGRFEGSWRLLAAHMDATHYFYTAN